MNAMDRAGELALWPAPAHVTATGGELRLDGPVALTLVGAALGWESSLLARLAWLAPRPTAERADAPGMPRVTVHADPDLAPEGYGLEVEPGGIRIRAATAAGAGHATAVLRQLVGPDGFRAAPLDRAQWRVPAVRIVDAPAHEWRGFLLDVARYFVPKEELLRIVERLSMHRLNRLHLHLTEDAGWRVESAAYPRLAEVGSWRAQTAIGLPRYDGTPPELDGTPHGGYYTAADLREITAYAALHGVVVVPEIDLPAHSSALMAAIPELVVPGCPVPTVAETFVPSTRVVSPLPAARRVLATLLQELADAVDSPYLHVGGDEASLRDWSAPAVTDHIAERGLAGVGALRADLTAYLVGVVESLGRRAIVWEEAFAGGGLSPRTIVMPWLGEARGVAAMDAGYDVVMSPMQSCYLDYSEDGEDGLLAIGSGMTIDRVAAYAPAPHPGPGRLLGVQAALWGEFTPDASTRSLRMFPRLAVHAANAWTGSPTPWPAARSSLERHLARLDAAGVAYRPLDGLHPWQRGGTGRRAMTSPLTVESVGRLMADLSRSEGVPDLEAFLDELGH
jgi:hexosaminidase